MLKNIFLDNNMTILVRGEKEQKVLLDGIEYDWLIVDHYKLDIQWEKQLRPFVKKILVIDDYINREHDCDVFLNQNY